jgi:hypothetical protein
LIGDKTYYDNLKTQLLVEFLTGIVGSESEQNYVSKIIKLVIVGNSISLPEKIPNQIEFKGKNKINVKEV